MNLHAPPPIPIDKNYIMSIILFAFWTIIKTTVFTSRNDKIGEVPTDNLADLTEQFLRFLAVGTVLFQLFALTYVNFRIVLITLVIDAVTVVVELWHLFVAYSEYQEDLTHAYTWDVSVIAFLLAVLQALINAYYLLVKSRIKEAMTDEEARRENLKEFKQNWRKLDVPGKDKGQ